MKVEYIICENKAERDAVLAKLEREGYVWGNTEPLTKWNLNDTWEDKSIALNIGSKAKRVLWAFTREDHRLNKNTVSAQDYLSKHKPILITRKGRVVTAEDKNTGDKAIATCCPTDTFDFGTGAMIAVARLIAQSDKGITKDAEVVLRQLLGDDVNSDAPAEEEPTTKFKVGDLVTLREGVKEGDHFGHLDVEYGAMFDQSYHKPIKVIEITRTGIYYCAPANESGPYFYYHEEMLEPWDENKIHEGDKVYVSSASRNYPYYTEWVYEHITDSDLTKRFGYGGSITDKDKVYEVVKIAPHKDGHPMLAYISPHVDTIGSCHLIDVDGLKKVTE